MTTRQLADFVADAVLASDLHNRVTYWNDAAARLFGWSATEVLGRDALELFRVSFKSASIEEAARQVAEAGRWSGIVTQMTKDGRTIPCEAIVARLPDGEGHVIVLRDLAERQILIDERGAAEASLEAALAFNTNLLEAAPVGILTYRISGPCVSSNAAAAQIVGASVEQLKQQNFRTLASWEDSGLLAIAERVVATRVPQASEVEMVTTYGRSVWLLVRLAVFRSQDEDILLLVLGDISELKRVQGELRKLSAAIEQNPSSVIITNRSGDIEYVNPSFSAMTGYASDEVIGQNPRMFRTGENLEETYRGLWATITGGETWRGELRNKDKSGALHWVRATISPIFDDREVITHFVAIEEHIDAQKAAEEAAREADRRFIVAQKMEGIGQLAGGIAHDFNNMLTAILGYSDLVLAAVADNPALMSDVAEIKKAGERAARLTRQLLAFSRRQRLESQAVNLNLVVGDLLKMLGRVIGENIHVDVAAEATLGLAMLDPGQIEQIVMNLVVNARDAMPDGGRLSIGTASVELDADFVRMHPGARAGHCVALRVSDTGTGMAPDIVARIFEPFFTTKPVGQGTGLGLATVYGIVKQSSGYIAVDSEVGVGTTFTIYFPRVSTATAATSASPSAERPLHGTETILVADDESGLRHVIHRVLTLYGYTVLLASDGVEALALEEQYAATIDLLLSDVIMHEMGGPELAQRMVSRRPQMKVLLMSGFEYRSKGQAGSIDVGTAFLPKPFTPDGLARKVREVLNHQT